jgi:hypothetical protein
MAQFNSRLVVEMDSAIKKRFRMACLQRDTEMSEEIRRFIERRVEELEAETISQKTAKK